MEAERVAVSDIETRETTLRERRHLAHEVAYNLTQVQDRRLSFLFAIWNLSEEGTRTRSDIGSQPAETRRKIGIERYADPLIEEVRGLNASSFSDIDVLAGFISRSRLALSTSKAFIRSIKRRLEDDRLGRPGFTLEELVMNERASGLQKQGHSFEAKLRLFVEAARATETETAS